MCYLSQTERFTCEANHREQQIGAHKCTVQNVAKKTRTMLTSVALAIVHCR